MLTYMDMLARVSHEKCELDFQSQRPTHTGEEGAACGFLQECIIETKDDFGIAAELERRLMRFSLQVFRPKTVSAGGMS